MDSSNLFITTIEEITSQRITGLLFGSLALKSGTVTGVHVEQDLTPPMSNIACVVKLAYSDDAKGMLPETVFFKNGRMFGEVSFARHVSPLLSHDAIVKCHSANFENELGQSNLIFEDIQGTHKFIDAQEAPTEKELEGVVTTLARFHKTGWEHPELGSDGKIGENLNDLPNNLALSRAKQLLESFFDTMGNDLSTTYRERYTRIFNTLPHPEWTQRLNTLENVTVVHGDVHTGNIALPCNENGTVKLLDWSLWHIDLPTYDLSYLLALHTSPELRNKVEKRLLGQYHTKLGVTQYSFEQLMADYRLSILFQTIWPVFFHLFTPKNIWIPLHNNIMQAFEDWGCEGLLG